MSQGAFEVAEDDFLGRDDLFDGGWLFYAVVAEVKDEDHPIAFVRQYNPQRGINPGRILGVYGQTLSKLKDPVFMFDLRFDVVVALDEVAVLGVTQFQRVFADVDIQASEVPGDVGKLEAAVNVPLAQDARRVLTDVCQEKKRLGVRLRKLIGQPHLALVTAQTLQTALGKHGMDPNRLGVGATIQLTDLDDVRLFVDVLEKRYYEEDFTGDTMRADNSSPLV